MKICQALLLGDGEVHTITYPGAMLQSAEETAASISVYKTNFLDMNKAVVAEEAFAIASCCWRDYDELEHGVDYDIVINSRGDIIIMSPNPFEAGKTYAIYLGGDE